MLHYCIIESMCFDKIDILYDLEHLVQMCKTQSH